MKILNVRAGVACNSSSSHSLLIPFPNALPIAGDEVEDGHYGWSYFTETNPARYFATLFYMQAKGMYGPKIASIVTSELFSGVTFDDEWYVDHQSVFQWPCNSDGNINLEFVAKFTSWAEHNNLIVLGGNDNDGSPHSLSSVGTTLEPPIGGKEVLAREDPLNPGLWTLYNTLSGMKARLWFGEGDEPVKGSPELLDVKVTNQCQYSCSYCYQASTPDGQHSPLSPHQLYDVAESIAKMKPLEVALGGGEPTAWPQLMLFASSLRSYGISVSLTTKNIGWLTSAKRTGWANPHPQDWNGIAFSPPDKIGSGLKKQMLQAQEIWGDKLVLNVIEHIHPLHVIKDLYELGFNICVLGYKSHGFGETFTGTDQWPDSTYAGIIDLASDWQFKLRVDTAFLRNNPELQEEFHPSSFHTTEGAWSGYIDLVEKKVGPSSYSSDEVFLDFDVDTIDTIPELFSQLPVEE